MARRQQRKQYPKPITVKRGGRQVPRPQIIVKGFDGRFMKLADRYSDKVASIWAYRSGRYVDLIHPEYTGQPVKPEDLMIMLRRDEFEKLPEAVKAVKSFKPKSRYQVWNLSEQIDRTKGIRRKLIKLTIRVRDGRRLRKVTMYTKVKGNQKRSYQIFKQINDTLGAEGFFTYDRVGSKLLADRKGRKISIEGIDVDEVI